MMESFSFDTSRQSTSIYLCIIASIILLIVLQRRSCGNMLFYPGAFFALFAFGPAINYLLGNQIYFGIREQYISEACFGFTLALAGLTASSYVVSASKGRATPRVNSDSYRLYELYPPVLVALILYGAIVVGRVLPVVTAGKLGQVALAGPWHSTYLLIELCVVPTYFLTRRTRLLRVLWLGNAVVYLAYCLATSERDFLFAFFSVLLHHYVIVRRSAHSVQVTAAALGAAVIATILFADRSGQKLGIAGVLNQGSLLFVDSFVMDWQSRQPGLAYGGTYLNTFLSLPPAWIHDSGLPSLSTWLVSLYAPGNSRGYGFSLSAEAFMNFGFVGIFFVFFLLGLSVSAAVSRFGQSDWSTFFSVYFVTIVLYAIRGDSSQLFKSIMYGAIFFAAISLSSSMEIKKHSVPWAGQE